MDQMLEELMIQKNENKKSQNPGTDFQKRMKQFTSIGSKATGLNSQQSADSCLGVQACFQTFGKQENVGRKVVNDPFASFAFCDYFLSRVLRQDMSPEGWGEMDMFMHTVVYKAWPVFLLCKCFYVCFYAGLVVVLLKY